MRSSTATFRTLTVLTMLNTVGFGVALAVGPSWPPALSWILPPVIIALAFALSRRVRTGPGAPAAVRRYWRTTTFGIAVFCGVTTLRLVDAMVGGGPFVPISVAGHVVGGVLMTAPLFGLPLGARTRGEKAALGLDVGTLMVAAGILIWHFAALPALDEPHRSVGRVLSVIAIMGAGISGVQLGARITLAGVESVSRRALYWIGASAVIGGLGSAVCLLLPLGLSVNPLVLLLPLAAYAAAVSARCQIVDSAAGAAAPRARRGYSLMPYVAVAAVDALLVVTTVRETADHLLVDGVAIVLTGLVIVRQLASFRQNDALLRRIGLQEQQFRLLVQNSTDIVTITDPDGTIRYVSPAVQRVLALAPGPLAGTNIGHRFHPDDQAILAENVAFVVRNPGISAVYQARVQHADGSWRWLEIISANLLAEPSVGGIVTNSRDITETRQVQDRLSFEASHDGLTGLANRALFGERVQAGVAHTDPAHRLSIVLIDLDDFKTVNDTLGHHVGDGLLVTVADRMRAGVRPTDTVARLGGDEFAILFEGLGGDAVERVLDRIAGALLEPVTIEENLLTVRASFGVVDGRGGDDAGELLRQADIAMYEAKARGEGGHERYQPGMEARGAERSRLATALRTAIAEDQLVLHYQPIVTLPEGRLTGVEALVRWQHPEQGLLGPGAFVETAEQTGLIVPLGGWVLRAATRQAAQWIETYGAGGPGTVSVNVSARQLREPSFGAEVADALVAAGLPASRLVIEITESTAVGGGATQDTLRELRDLGVRLSLDDFGTGASTLSLLATCPVDQIKLDRSFTPAPGADAIATAVVQLAAAFGVEAVAEGVETLDQAERLESLGYRRAQGFYFARPMAAAHLADRLTELAGHLAGRP
jgi:diguanylate cyclase (GGDEF)-like protein/PAS domain S-box-containing protein